MARRGDNKAEGRLLISALEDLNLPVELISLAIQHAAEDEEDLENVTDLKNNEEDKVFFWRGRPRREIIKTQSSLMAL